MLNSNLFKSFLVGCLITVSASAVAQTTTADALFKAARNASFEEKDRAKAIALLQQALIQSPGYADVETFLGRLYTWTGKYDSASYHFENTLSYAPKNEDVYIAYTDLEYWNDNYNKALVVADRGLTTFKASEALLIKKAKVLIALRRFKEAAKVSKQLLTLNNKNTEAIALATSIRDAAAANKIAVSYDYVSFGRQGNKPWNFAGISYTRQTKLGSVSANVNYANRFGKSGWQGEVEAYTNINRTFYSYVSFGYSANDGVFPKYRAGVSLYANLPKSFEAEAGVRYLNFGNPTYIYTFYAGKYISNLLFSARTFITPGIEGISQVYFFSGRYYLKGADDYLGLTVGTGVSPDDRSLNLQYSDQRQLHSKRASITFNHSISSVNIVSFKAGWLQEEASAEGKIYNNQCNFTVGFARRF